MVALPNNGTIAEVIGSGRNLSFLTSLFSTREVDNAYWQNDRSELRYFPFAPLADKNRLVAASTPSDYTTDGLDLRLPTSYHQQVARLVKMSVEDALFGRLLHSIAHYGNNGGQWLVKEKAKRGEREFWESWSAYLNISLSHVQQGQTEVTDWLLYNLALSGMCATEWKWGVFKVGKKIYEAPVAMICHPPIQTVVRRRGDRFLPDHVGIIKSQNIDSYSTFIKEQVATRYINDNELRFLDPTESALVRWHWTPGQASVLTPNLTGGHLYILDDMPERKYGRRVDFMDVGISDYPVPPFIGLQEKVALRQRLFQMDLTIANGIINYAIIVKVGTKDYPPEPERVDENGTVTYKGDLATIKDILDSSSNVTANAIRLIFPFYVDIEMKTQDSSPLLNSEKYLAATNEILGAFGIIIAGRGGASQAASQTLNMRNFAALIDHLRMTKIKPFWERMAYMIWERNQDKLSRGVIWQPNPLSLEREEVMTFVMDAFRQGRVSTQTLLSLLGLDKEAEVSLLVDQADEKKYSEDAFNSENELFSISTPIAYRQTAPTLEQEDVGGAEKQKELFPAEDKTSLQEKASDRLANNPGGRPKGKSVVGQ